MGKQKADTSRATKEVGRQLRKRRDEKRLTLDDMADVIDRSHLSAIEMGKVSPTVDTLYTLSKKLEIDMGDLMGEGVYQTARKLGKEEYAEEFKAELPRLDEEAREAMEGILRSAVVLARKTEKKENG